MPQGLFPPAMLDHPMMVSQHDLQWLLKTLPHVSDGAERRSAAILGPPWWVAMAD
jgi:hypothetical protein